MRAESHIWCVLTEVYRELDVCVDSKTVYQTKLQKHFANQKIVHTCKLSPRKRSLQMETIKQSWKCSFPLVRRRWHASASGPQCALPQCRATITIKEMKTKQRIKFSGETAACWPGILSYRSLARVRDVLAPNPGLFDAVGGFRQIAGTLSLSNADLCCPPAPETSGRAGPKSGRRFPLGFVSLSCSGSLHNLEDKSRLDGMGEWRSNLNQVLMWLID